MIERLVRHGKEAEAKTACYSCAVNEIPKILFEAKDITPRSVLAANTAAQLHDFRHPDHLILVRILKLFQ